MSRAARHIIKHIKAAGRHVLRTLHPRNPAMNADEPCSGQKTTSVPFMPIRATALEQRYISIQLLGSGGNGEVHLCHDIKLGTMLAVKSIQHDPYDGPSDEVKVLQFLGKDRHELAVRRLPLEGFDDKGSHPEAWFGTSGPLVPPGTEEPVLYKHS